MTVRVSFRTYNLFLLLIIKMIFGIDKLFRRVHTYIFLTEMILIPMAIIIVHNIREFFKKNIKLGYYTLRYTNKKKQTMMKCYVSTLWLFSTLFNKMDKTMVLQWVLLYA